MKHDGAEKADGGPWPTLPMCVPVRYNATRLITPRGNRDSSAALRLRKFRLYFRSFGFVVWHSRRSLRTAPCAKPYYSRRLSIGGVLAATEPLLPRQIASPNIPEARWRAGNLKRWPPG